MLIWPPTTLVLTWPDGPSSSRWKRRAASLPFGTRTKSSSCFPSKAWSARRWSWPTICSTSSTRRWLLLAVLLSVGPGKSDSRLCGEKELDIFFHPPAFSRACLSFGQVREPLVSLPDQNVGSSEAIASRGRSSICFTLIFLTHSSFSLFTLCRFDEPTPPAVTMTESRTLRGRYATR